MKHILKSIARKLTRHIRIPIQAGPCAGLVWSLPTRANYLRGVYESAVTNFVAAALLPNHVFWDVGAHFGYYTLLAARRTPQGQCLSFEPNPDNRWYLDHHVAWNHLKNVTVFPYAITAENGSSTFGGGGTGGGSLRGGTQEVQTRSVDALVQSGACRTPTFMKIDVEGAEIEVLKCETVKHMGGFIFVATHGPGLHAESVRILTGYGYTVHDSAKRGLIVAFGRDHIVSAELLRHLPTHSRND